MSNMYTTDKREKAAQQEETYMLLTRMTRKTRQKRQTELDLWWGVYQSFGRWQDAIDILENFMAIWGRKEYIPNRWYDLYDQTLHSLQVESSKAIWEEKDHIICGQARAYSEARYLARFWIPDALQAGIAQRKRQIESVAGNATPTDLLKQKACCEQLEMLLQEHS